MKALLVHMPRVTDRQLWVVSCATFLAGILLPMFTFNSFYIFNDSFSLMGGILHLLRAGELFLFVLLFSFSVLGPVYKLYLCSRLIGNRTIAADTRIKMVKRLAFLGKWSMADVFVVAIIAATLKMGMIGSIEIHVGLVVFGLAVLTSMWLVQRQLSAYELRPIDEAR